MMSFARAFRLVTAWERDDLASLQAIDLHLLPYHHGQYEVDIFSWAS